ncbi:MAG TPA: FadR family transcriptional regulator [Ruminococcaceae bacterium]|jgi:DNA-binding FadR family transcriptional regulator|nr:FadR family transcriptional regulator [Oscillospiraceae bacterium]
MKKMLIENRELPLLLSSKLREMIAEKGMKPGDRMPSEGELVEMFGVGRSTVREAVKLLLADNVVEIHRGRGTYLTEAPGVKKDPLGLGFSNQNKLLQNLLESRLLIEPQIARLAALRATGENLSRLSRAIGEMDAAEKQKAKDFPSRDVEFHTAVAECTQNDVLYRILPLICDSIREGYLETMNVPGSNRKAIESHIRIFEAIRSGNPDDAMKQMRLHILQAMDDAKIVIGGMKK